MGVYNENRDKNQNMHDEIREQNAKLKGAPLKEKIAYFKDYYLKVTIAILIGIGFVVALMHSVLSGPRDTAFAALFFNDMGDSSDTTLADQFAEYMNIDTNEHQVYIDASMNYHEAPDVTETPETQSSAYDLASSMYSYNDYVEIEKTMALIASKELDVIMGDEEAFSYFTKAECFGDVREFLSPSQLEKFKDDFYYYTNPETGEQIPVGIYVTGAPKLEEFYYYYGDVKPIFGFLINSQNKENAVAFLDYIYFD